MLRELVNRHFIAEITIPVALGNTSLPGLITFVGLTAEYPSTNLHKNSVYCILTRSSKNAAKFKQ